MKQFLRKSFCKALQNGTQSTVRKGTSLNSTAYCDNDSRRGNVPILKLLRLVYDLPKLFPIFFLLFSFYLKNTRCPKSISSHHCSCCFFICYFINRLKTFCAHEDGTGKYLLTYQLEQRPKMKLKLIDTFNSNFQQTQTYF